MYKTSGSHNSQAVCPAADRPRRFPPECVSQIPSAGALLPGRTRPSFLCSRRRCDLNRHDLLPGQYCPCQLLPQGFLPAHEDRIPDSFFNASCPFVLPAAGTFLQQLQLPLLFQFLVCFHSSPCETFAIPWTSATIETFGLFYFLTAGDTLVDGGLWGGYFHSTTGGLLFPNQNCRLDRLRFFQSNLTQKGRNC